jgi:hypothetical protein
VTVLNHFASLLFLMIGAHALADGPLQDKAMRARKGAAGWSQFQGLAQHGLIHGLMVALITGVWWLGVAETVAHAAIDWAKGRGIVSHAEDQAMHVCCKVAWAGVALASM